MVTSRSRFGSRWRKRSSFRFGDSSHAPSTLPLFLSTTWTRRAKSCSGSNGMEKVNTSVDAPSNCTSETSSSVSALPSLCRASFCNCAVSFSAFFSAAGCVAGASFFAAVGALSLLSHPASASMSMQATTRMCFIFHPWPVWPVSNVEPLLCVRFHFV
ncbi:hypothetical protein SDC9_182602 [bioreactor metagenome]|uniref:Uncharacterized protein n=1 Tax=bioreactor metagenome TaxID=1076179 RepID=A0A645H7U9_9ZZZZ